MSDALTPQVGDVVVVVELTAVEAPLICQELGYARPGDMTVVRDAPDLLRDVHPGDYWVDREVPGVGASTYPGRAWGWARVVRRPTEAELADYYLNRES